MTSDEFLAKVLEVVPGAEIGEDNDGQIVIYTNMGIDEVGQVVPFEDGDDSIKVSGGFIRNAAKATQ